MATWLLPAELSSWIALLAVVLDARIAWRLEPMLVGLLFARGRRTITSWLRAVGIGEHYEDYYYFLGSLGRKCESVAGVLLGLLLRRCRWGSVLFALDDCPRAATAEDRRGRHPSQPTPGPAGSSFSTATCGSLAAVVRHPKWGTIAPLLARLYVRADARCWN